MNHNTALNILSSILIYSKKKVLKSIAFNLMIEKCEQLRKMVHLSIEIVYRHSIRLIQLPNKKHIQTVQFIGIDITFCVFLNIKHEEYTPLHAQCRLARANQTISIQLFFHRTMVLVLDRCERVCAISLYACSVRSIHTR